MNEMDSLGRTMRNYHAWFTNGEKTVSMNCDGISATHAKSRAWLKFMGTQLYKEHDSWRLEEFAFVGLGREMPIGWKPPWVDGKTQKD